MTVKLPTKHHLEFLCLKGGCTGLSESTLVKMPHYWKSHVRVHLFLASYFIFLFLIQNMMGALWLSGRVLDSRLRGRVFEPHRLHFVVILEQDTFIVA